MAAEPAARPLQGRRVLVVAAYDSFLRSATFYADELARQGAEVDHILAFAGTNQVSEAQARAAGLKAVPRTMSLGAIARRKVLDGYDVVLLSLDGSRTRRFMVSFRGEYRAPGARRPITVSFYPGLLFRYHLEGMSCRISSDIFLLNSRHDYELYASLCQNLGLRHDNALLAGISVIPTRQNAGAPVNRRGGSILFVGQPTVPAWRHERAYLVDRLVTLAERHPGTPVVLKPRHRRNEKTLHTEHHHFEDLLDELKKRRPVPPNLSVRYDSMASMLAEAQLCVTVSSTAALEAVAAGIPARIITDFGVHENLGNHFFLDSGLLCELDALAPGMPHVVDRAWLDRHVESASDHLPEVVERVVSQLEQRDRQGSLPLPNERLFGRPEAFDRYVVEHYGESYLGLLGDGGWAKMLPRWTRVIQRANAAVASLRRW